jgi:membrane fusion protein (multidrug efflux system)
MRRLVNLLIIGIAAALLTGFTAAQDQAPSVQVQLTKLKKGNLPRTVSVYGTIEPSAAASRTITSPTSAAVDEIYVRRGQVIEKDAPLLRLSPRPAIRAAYAQAESALRVASDLVARTRDMVRQHLATAQHLADAQKSEADAKSALAALQAQGAGGVDDLRAPFRAIVTAISTNPGTLVSEGTELLTLAEPGGLVLKAGAIPAEAVSIAADDPATVSALGGGKDVAGKVTLRGEMVDSASGLIPVEIALPKTEFLPGQAAVAKITTAQITGYVVPHEAILVDDQGRPYVVQAIDMTAKQVPVRVLDAQGNQDVIDGPLDATAPLVLAGNHQLKDGMKMRVGGPAGQAAP